MWRLDTLGRTAKGLTSLFEDLIRWKVNLISFKHGLDLVTPAGRLMANILAGVAAYEIEVRAERILAGQAAARERGVRRGGSIRGRRSRATVEPIAVIRRLRSAGREIAAIARATGLSRPTNYRILGEDCNYSSGFSVREPVGRVAARQDKLSPDKRRHRLYGSALAIRKCRHWSLGGHGHRMGRSAHSQLAMTASCSGIVFTPRQV
jgi:hypothetical protein